MDAQIKRRDVEQLAPDPGAVPVAALTETQTSLFDLPQHGARIGSRIGDWAATYRPPVPGTSEAQPFGDRHASNRVRKNIFSVARGGSEAGRRRR